MAIKTKEKDEGQAADGKHPEGIGPGAGKAKKKLPIVPIVAGIAAIAGLIFGIRYLVWSKSHVNTDDAQIVSDLVQIAPQVNGTVTHVYVLDNQSVKAGELLVDLDPATYQVAVDQAQANVDVSKATSQGAGVSVGLTSQSTQAQLTQAQAGIDQANAGVLGSIADYGKSQAAVSSANATVATSQANVSSAQANVTSMIAAQAHAADALRAAIGQANTAMAGLRAAQATVRASQASADRATRDAQRYAALFAQGAISASVNDQASSAAEVAQAQLQASRDAQAQASANVQTAQANAAGARSQVDAARAAVTQARAGIAAAQGQLQGSRDQVRQASAAVTGFQAAISAAKGKVLAAKGQYTQAATAPKQVNVSKANAGEAGARIETAEAQLKSANIDLRRTKIYAPVDGRISKKTVTVGNLVSPGTPLMSLIPNEQPWVIANFKETQLTNVRIGQPVEVEVDAFPGKTFHGTIQSISGGTGATFALLPPDNATGNFTKIVQRVPVKIVFDKGQEGLDRLTVGMSVSATITTDSQ